MLDPTLDPSPWLRLALCVLAVWRVAHLVAHEDGPFDLVVRLRARAGDGLLGQLMDCPYCLSLWLAAPAAPFLALRLPGALLAWLAISGGASLVERLWRAAPDPTTTPADGAHDDALLRTEASRPHHPDPDRPPSAGAAHDPHDPTAA